MRSMSYPVSCILLITAWPVWGQVATAPSTSLLIGSSDVVVFFGDELMDTPQRQGQILPDNFAVMVESFLTVRYAEVHARYVHVGWMGDTAAKALQRLDRDVLVHKPTVAVLCFGLNDPDYQPFAADKLEAFKRDLTTLVNRCRQAGVKVWLLSPPSVEDDKQKERKTPIIREGQRVPVDFPAIKYNETLGKYAAAVGETAQAGGCGLVDWYAESTAARAEGRKLQADFSLTIDGRMPTMRGQALGAAAILRAWGAKPIEVDVELDWGKTTATLRTHVQPGPVTVPVEVTPEGRRVLNLPQLPMPWPVGGSQYDVLRPEWEAAALCRFNFKMANPPAKGVIVVDQTMSRKQKPIPAEQLRQGYNLVSFSPLRNAKEVRELASMIALKNTYRYATWRKLELAPPLEPELAEAHKLLKDAWSAFAAGYEQIIKNRPKVFAAKFVFAEEAPESRPATQPAPQIRIIKPPGVPLTMPSDPAAK